MYRLFFAVFVVLGVIGECKADGVLRCDNCSNSTERLAVKNSTSYGYHYVFDMTEGAAKRYLHDFDAEMKMSIVYEVATPTSLKSLIQSYISAYTTYRNIVMQNPNMLKDVIEEVVGVSISSSSSRREIQNIQTLSNSVANSCNSDGPNDIKIHDFIVNTSLRRSVYKKALLYYPQIQGAFNAWNTLVKHVDFNAGVVGVDTNMFSISQTIVFPDGASLDVSANPAFMIFDIVPGSPQDCNGNSIPLPSEPLTGDYQFNTAEDAHRFAAYTNYFGASLGNYPVCTSASFVKCNWNNSTGIYRCNFTCM